MNPVILSTSGPYRRYCRCWGCHPRRGWRRRTRLALLVIALFISAFLLAAGCSRDTAGLPGDPDGLPAADAGADIVPPVQEDAGLQRKVLQPPDSGMVDVSPMPDTTPPLEVGTDMAPASDASPDLGRCDPFTGCEGGRRCDSTCASDPPRICNPSKGVPVGGACSDHDDCEPGSICPAAPSGVCRKLCGLGHACPAGQTCSLGWCPEGVGYCL